MQNRIKTNQFKCAFRSLSLIASSLLIATPSFAVSVTPVAHLESAQVIGAGNKFQAFHVPTTNNKGTVNYYDVSVDLNILSNGKIDTTAVAINAAPSPQDLDSVNFVPGVYADGQGTVCKVSVGKLPPDAKRTQSTLSCKDKKNFVLEASWITGPLYRNLFQKDLTAAKINELPTQDAASWGKVSFNTRTFWGCITKNDIVSANQVGNSIAVGGYDSSNIQVCGVNLTKQ